MNLAEIRKKSEGAKKTVTVTPPVPPAEVGSGVQFPEQEVAAFVPETESWAPSLAAEELVAPLELFVEPEEFLLADEPLPEAAVDEPREITAHNDETPNVAAQTVAAAAPAVVPAAAAAARPEIAPGRTAYNPLATILAGRDEAVDPEESAAFQQQSLAGGDIEEYLCFRVADEEYALNIMAIKEIIKPREVTEVPRVPNFISGVISLRGVIIPVMDMRLRLSLPVRAATGRERIIVLRTDAGFCGVLVDEVVQVARIQRADIEQPPAVLEEIDRDFVKGLGHFDNRMLILLNLETVIDISIH
jgi:purine-binding chemotaxis protein CheW